MRHRVFIRGGYRQNNLSEAGGEASGPVFLHQNPTVLSQAATKQYVDSSAETIDAAAFTDGVLSPERIPAFTGDITKGAGSSIISISPVGVSAGNYTKVTTNIKGQVTAGTVLVEGDIPPLDWAKVADTVPTTLAGYGIVDGLSAVNPNMNGVLKVSGAFNSDDEIVNKEYVDLTLVARSRVGEIEYKLDPVTPTGYLRCNGGEVSKSTYAALYAVIGDEFSNIQTPGAGRPWEQQYAFNDTQNGAISNWTTGTSLPYSVMYHRCVVTKNRIYMLGGFIGSTVSSIVYSAPINADGTLGTWVAGTNLPEPLAYFATVVIKNKLYLIGGGNGSEGVATVYVANINADGTLGVWTTSAPLPAIRNYPATFVTKNKLFVIGGSDNTSNNSTVFVANINADGTLGAWVTSTPVPVTMVDPSVAVVKNKVYLISGVGDGAYSPTIYSAVINADGSLDTWVNAGNPLPVGLAYGSVFVTKTAVYMLGGAYGQNLYTRNIYRATINVDGSLGTWVNTEQIPYIVGYNAFVVVKNKVHILGGYANNAITATVSTGTIVGGTNDYSPYYDGSYLLTDDDKFRLPEIKPSLFESYAYIKY